MSLWLILALFWPALAIVTGVVVGKLLHRMSRDKTPADSPKALRPLSDGGQVDYVHTNEVRDAR